MDLFKNFKDLKNYCTKLSELLAGINVDGVKLKIGKFIVVETPSKDAANRLKGLMHKVIEEEHQAMTGIYKKIETAFEEIQTDLFKNNEETEEKTVKFGKKAQ